MTTADASNARLRVLADASHAFAMVVTDYPQLLRSIARTTADRVGDGCMVTLIDPDGETLVNVANAHRDPALEADYAAYLRRRAMARRSTLCGTTARASRWSATKLFAPFQRLHAASDFGGAGSGCDVLVRPRRIGQAVESPW